MTPSPRTSVELPGLAHSASFPSANPAAVTLVTEDGFPIAGTRFLAAGDPHGVVLIAPATGVPHRFYLRFAEYLSQQGFDVLAWDWRGIGASCHECSLRDPRLTMRAWGEQDLAAAIAWAERRTARGRIAVVGHSFGGQAIGLAANAGRVERAVLVAAQDGWMGNWSPSPRLLLWPLWYLAMPASALLLGRFPSSLLGLGEDLPAGVAREWARWCRRPEFLATWDGHATLDIPLLALSFADDPIAPRKAAEALLRRYARARIEHEHLPAAGLGHFGFFREGRAPELWQRVARFLLGEE